MRSRSGRYWSGSLANCAAQFNTSGQNVQLLLSPIGTIFRLLQDLGQRLARTGAATRQAGMAS